VKNSPQNLGAQHPLLHWGLPTCPHSKFRISLLPSQCSHFNANAPWNWESIYTIILPLEGWDPGFGFQQAQLCSQKMRVLSREYREATGQFVKFNWAFESLNSQG
jgi:hypothetical protein